MDQTVVALGLAGEVLFADCALASGELTASRRQNSLALSSLCSARAISARHWARLRRLPLEIDGIDCSRWGDEISALRKGGGRTPMSYRLRSVT